MSRAMSIVSETRELLYQQAQERITELEASRDSYAKRLGDVKVEVAELEAGEARKIAALHEQTNHLLERITELEAKVETAEDVRSLLLKADREAQAKVANLEAALRELRDVINAAGLINLSLGVQLGQSVWYVKAKDAMAAVDEALTGAGRMSERADIEGYIIAPLKQHIAELEAALREARDHCLNDDISTAVTVIDWALKEQGE